ncbi:MAG: hypothetical protein JRI23_03485 [Deltaproteobacteria bacterium]|jgi:alpha-tubulin suppressor-like RCC1 family protein|nr:hypothetical protein [Deltaproteobacteria bacterium]MBW2530578.1 hypothetical protein [Deltaproteobacteria bacterium]
MLPRAAVAMGVWACTLGCNELSGLSGLEKVDCAGGTCTGQAGGGGTGGTTTTSTGVAGASSYAPSIAAFTLGRHGACVTDGNDGLTRCWGAMIGNGTAGVETRPALAAGGLELAGVGHGFDHRCGYDSIGNVWCWGGNDFGQLGDGTDVTRVEPAQVTGLTEVERLSHGAHHTCAMTVSGGLFCWGANRQGQLGTGDTLDRSTPTEITGFTDVLRLACGTYSSCLVLTTGEVYCWGLNDHGQLGFDPQTDPVVLTPRQIPGIPAMERIYPGHETMCSRTLGTRLMYCWGDNEFGQLGDGTNLSTHVPQQVDQIDEVGVAFPGMKHTCVVDTTDAAYCWGANDHGQLGVSTATPAVNLPQLVADSVKAFGAKTAESTCYADWQDAIYCTGLNDSGQLGDGTYDSRDSFEPVLF